MYPALYNEVITWIQEGARVLDLGSGDGGFLEKLIVTKKVIGEGVEKNHEKVVRCIERGLVIYQGDIRDGLDQYDASAFDYILLLGTFEELEAPQNVLKEAFRVGSKVIISYHNFSYWRSRIQLMFGGQAPRTAAMRDYWYNIPTGHYFSISDFRVFCNHYNLIEIQSLYFNSTKKVKLFPNLCAEFALTILENGGMK